MSFRRQDQLPSRITWGFYQMQIHKPCIGRFDSWPRNLHFINSFHKLDALGIHLSLWEIPLLFHSAGGLLPGPEADNLPPRKSILNAAYALTSSARMKNENNAEKISTALPRDDVHICKAFHIISPSYALLICAPSYICVLCP